MIPTDTLRKLAEAGGLIERLRETYSAGGPRTVRQGQLRNRDGIEAADALTALLDENQRMRDQIVSMQARLDRWEPNTGTGETFSSGQAIQDSGNPL